jgi:hypothetical protein
MKLLRYVDLKARGFCTSWAQLKQLQTKYGFPVGRMISPQVRARAEHEIDAWYEARPTEGPPLKGNAKRLAEGTADPPPGSTRRGRHADLHYPRQMCSPPAPPSGPVGGPARFSPSQLSPWRRRDAR